MEPTSLAEWDPSAKGWAIKFVRFNLWRVSPDLEFDDLMQEAALVYARCKSKYPERENIMPTFKISLRNEIHFLSDKRTRRRKHEVSMSVLERRNTEGYTLSEPFGTEHSFDEIEFQILLEDNPDIAQLWKLFVEGECKPRRIRSRSGKGSQTTNQFLCWALGLDPKQSDAVRGIREFLLGELNVSTC